MTPHENLKSIKFIKDGGIKEVEIPNVVLNELTENPLANLAYTEPDIFDVLILTAKKAQLAIQKGKSIDFSFDDIVELVRENNGERDAERPREKVERSLDVLLDIGFFTAKWVPKEDGEEVIVERRFQNRGEVATALESTNRIVESLGNADINRYPSNILSVKDLIDSYEKAESYETEEDKKLDLEGEINSIIQENVYEGLYPLLEEYEEETLGALYKKTEEREIDLKKEEGKRIWGHVIEFYEKKDQVEKVDSIYSRLAEYSRTKFQQIVYDFAYDAVASTWWAITFDPEVGRQSADNFANYLSKKKQEKLKRMLTG